MGFSSLTRYDLFWESGNIIENGDEVTPVGLKGSC